MNKTEVRELLGKMFGGVHVEGWLSTFPDSHLFVKQDVFRGFIEYNNSKCSPALGPPNTEREYGGPISSEQIKLEVKNAAFAKAFLRPSPLEKLRQTRRTSFMMEEVKNTWLARGQTVVVWSSSEEAFSQQQKFVQELKFFTGRITVNYPKEVVSGTTDGGLHIVLWVSSDSPHWDWETLTWEGFEKAKVYVDHHVLEAKYRLVLEHWERWRQEPQGEFA